MPHKKKHKKLLRRIKKKQKKGKPNVADMTDLFSRPFVYSEHIANCSEAIIENFKPLVGKYFRLVHKPIDENDSKVQAEQVFLGLDNTNTKVSDRIDDEASIEDKLEQVKDWSLSFNISDRLLAEFMLNQYDARKSETSKANFLLRKGDSIAQFDFPLGTGIVEKDADEGGHVVIQLYEDINLDDYMDEEFGYVSLFDYRDGKK